MKNFILESFPIFSPPQNLFGFILPLNAKQLDKRKKKDGECALMARIN